MNWVLKSLARQLVRTATLTDGRERRRCLRPYSAWMALAIVLSLAAIAQPQASSTAYEPTVGQAGKDVVWVPTPQSLVEKMLDIAKVTPQDHLIDLGSGDGRTVITAARRGLKAHGIEYNPEMVELAKKNAAEAGVSDRATFAKADLFESDFSDAQVITMFLLPSINTQLRPKLFNLRPGTRIVSNTFAIENWQADETIKVDDGCTTWCTALLWIVPAKVEGTWQLDGKELRLTQNFQMLSGTLGPANISDARLRGNDISFSVDGRRYSGIVDKSTMKGTVAGGPVGVWAATRE